MVYDWPQMTKDYSAIVKELHSGPGSQGVMKSFSTMARAAMEPKALDTKTKELIALAVAVASRCDPCVAFHGKAAFAQGATREEVEETIATAIYMGAGPSVMYAAKALECFDQFAAASAPAPAAAE